MMEGRGESSEGASKKSPFDELSRDELVNKCKGLLVIAQKAKHSKSDLQNEVDNYKLKLEKCETEKKVSLDNIQTLQELVDSLTEQKLNFITEVDSAKSKIKTLYAKCNDYEDEINKNKADLIVKSKIISDLTQKLSDIDSETISLKRQNNRLTEENEQLINQLTEIEARTAEFNNIGLQQQEQLQILEERVQKDEDTKNIIEDLNEKIKELEIKLQSENEKAVVDYENKIKELTDLYESEKSKKEKVNVKLRSYKDKILKCAACINQLKNSRFILSKTVKEYSENIPKWQNDIIKASKVLEEQINELNNENMSLKEQVKQMEHQMNEAKISKDNLEIHNNQIMELSNENQTLKSHLIVVQEQLKKYSDENLIINENMSDLKTKYHHLEDSILPAHINENKIIKEQLNEHIKMLHDAGAKNSELLKSIEALKNENKDLIDTLQTKTYNNEAVDNLNLQIRALESEKSSLLKEKLNARDSVVELETKNKIFTDQVATMTLEIESLKSQVNLLSQEKSVFEKKHKAEKDGEVNMLRYEIMSLQEQCDRIKKEYEDMQDLNGLLREEVETLKLSLEQPKDDNLSDLNMSLQADVVKLETKLAAYKQENSSLLAEVKESRNKIKEFDSLVTEAEDAKSKLSSYKTENTELLNEMKEINQVLKERGEAISKLQKAIGEMESLVETLEKDRDDLKQEKMALSENIDILKNELKNAEQKTAEHGDTTNQLIGERDRMAKHLEEKDNIISSLRDEVERLKQHHSTIGELPNDDNISTSTISKAEEHSRMKDLDESFEEKYSKLRIFALKLKKKLNETATQLQNTEQDKAKLEKLLSENMAIDKKSVTPLSHDVVDSGKTNNFDDAKLQDKIKSLSMSLETAKQEVAELEKVKAELSVKSQQLSMESEAHNVTKENLEKARRDVKKKNVLSLEMEDYERSMKELTTKMEESKRKMVQMESTIDTQEGTITAMKTQIKLLEEQIKSEETQNRLLKEDLQHAIEERKEKDNVILIKNGIISKLEHDLENEKRKNEEADLEMTSLLSDKEKIIMNLGEDKAELNNKVKRLEFKSAELNENLRILNIELADLKTEYTSYKVRAQAVLRQNQTVDHSQEEQLKEEAAALRAQIESLTAKLATAQELCTEQTAEAENARRRTAEAANEATRAQQRTARLHADLTRIAQQLESERTQHKLQVSTLTQCYKTQISDLEARLQKETDVLKKQLLAAQENAKPGKSIATVIDESNSQYMLPVIPKDDGSDGEMDINVSMIPREEGEGSESGPSPPPSKTYLSGAGSNRSPVPLERLLEEGVPDDEALDISSLGLTPDQEIADLKRRLLAQQQRVKHVTVLLSESERECARMAQLSELLKAELRRVRGTSHNAHNTEYMKNVTLKFLTLPPGDERSRLVPVLQKILTLTNEETQKIHAIARGLDPNPSKGWGSYLPWPGGK